MTRINEVKVTEAMIEIQDALARTHHDETFTVPTRTNAQCLAVNRYLNMNKVRVAYVLAGETVLSPAAPLTLSQVNGSAAERVTTVLNLMAVLEQAYQNADRTMGNALMVHNRAADYEYFNGKMNGIRECINTLHFSILRKHDAA